MRYKRLNKFLFVILASWIIFLLVGVWVNASAQSIELVRPADFRYHVTVDGDTVASRSLEYKAIQDAVNFMGQFPNSLIVVHPTGIEFRGSPPVIYDYDIIYETVYDTLYVDRVDTVTVTNTIIQTDTVRIQTTITDTVFVDRPVTEVDTVFVTETITNTIRDTVEVVRTEYVTETSKVYDSSYGFSSNPWPAALDSIYFEVRENPADTLGLYRLRMTGTTTASEVSFATNCFGFNGANRNELINERISGRDSTDLHNEILYETQDLKCQGIMTLWVTERDSNNFAVHFLDVGQILSLQ